MRPLFLFFFPVCLRIETAYWQFVTLYDKMIKKVRTNVHARSISYMNKEEFLQGLSDKLSEDLSPGEVEEQVAYYRGYIDGELKKGRTEEEATFDLGDPILIARNLVESPPSYRVNTTSAYEQGMAESEYPDTRGLAGEKADEEYVPENADAYAETYTDTADYSAENDWQPERSSSDHEGDHRGYKEAERNATFDNGFFESGQKQSIERGGFTSLFKRSDGGINWRLISILMVIILVVLAVVTITAKVVITFWPVILIMLVISLIFSRTGGGR
ncbi:MAG TPA: hypothetical protein DCG37_08850 [Lachnospiraceae bacterium]|nr:hypothetical protein [Lachnospiraceae bacterium]